MDNPGEDKAYLSRHPDPPEVDRNDSGLSNTALSSQCDTSARPVSWVDPVRRSTFHEYVSKRLNFPGYYGFNLDALWDCLTDYAVSNPEGRIRLEGLADFKRLNPFFSEKVLQCFSDLSKNGYSISIEYYDSSPSGEGLAHE